MGLEVKSTVAMPPATLAVTRVLAPLGKLWSRAADSPGVGPTRSAPRSSVRVALRPVFTVMYRDTGATVPVDAARKISSGTSACGGTVDGTVVGLAGLSRLEGTSPLAMAVGPPAVGMPHAAVATTTASTASPRRPGRRDR